MTQAEKLDLTHMELPGTNRRVLNVGGHTKHIILPTQYAGFEHVLLDIDPAVNPDVLGDARNLFELEAEQFDAVYCSHNLEHYFRHEVDRVLKGFLHVLKPGCFAHIRVPDLEQVFKAVIEGGMDLDDVLYEAPAGSITPLDTIYGYAREIEASGTDYFAHKTGFTNQSLFRTLLASGFGNVYNMVGHFEIGSIATKGQPQDWVIKLLELPSINGGRDNLVR